MKLCNDTITVFNAKLDQTLDATVYVPTVIHGVSWYGGEKSTVDANGLKAASQYTIRMPLKADAGGKSYVDPVYWRNSADVAGLYTLNEGDLMVKGAYTDMLTLPAQIKALHGVTILAVTDNRRAPNAPHWKVVGT